MYSDDKARTLTLADAVRTWGSGCLMVHPALQDEAQRLMEAECERARMINGLRFVLEVDRKVAERLLAKHGVDYELFLEGGKEYERAKSIVAKL